VAPAGRRREEETSRRSLPSHAAQGRGEGTAGLAAFEGGLREVRGGRGGAAASGWRAVGASGGGVIRWLADGGSSASEREGMVGGGTEVEA
jgi:hypothetical protein